MSSGPVDANGWLVWPPPDESIQQSIADTLRTGDWGCYQSAAHARCVDAITELLTPPGTSILPGTRSPSVRLCSSGSAGIELALRGSGVAYGNEVVVSAYDYPGNFRTIELLGATPVLADVRPGGVTMDAESLRRIDGSSIVAVLVSHLFGELADIVPIREICDKRNWVLIEDACQVPGAKWWSEHERARQPVGSLADAVVLSFGGSKLLSTGNGGAVLTRNERMTARINAFADRPSDVFAYSSLQSAALLPQLSSLPTWNSRRCEMAARLSDLDWSRVGAIPLSAVVPQQTQAFYKFAILPESTEAKRSLTERFSRIALPFGEGFRSTHATSVRRSRKPVPLDNASCVGERCLVIDHRALLTDDLVQRINLADAASL